MARPSIHQPRKRQRPRTERPVLQLPLARPIEREPREPTQEREPERGVAVIDFFI
ncbi:hypothetical protein [Plesiocystis pacifica]|uniref:hypothetical protein n=1 Tax=Plesiocystis pacifica TaxID=191768 RepID=UPI000305DFD5|nr:hypothetical protein [Plesiocystis pacifica]